MSTINLSQSGFLTCEWERGFMPIKKGALSATQIYPRQMKALELGCMAMA
jgi:hypothetical protein